MRAPSTPITLAVCLGVVLAGAVVVIVVLHPGQGSPGAPLPTCTGPPSSTVPLVIAPESLDSGMIAVMQDQLATCLRAGDTIMLSSGAGSSDQVASAGQLESWLATLGPSLPSGVNFEARTSGLTNVQGLSTSLSHAFDGIIYDYEPGFEPEFSTNFTTTMENFQNFSRFAHAGGFKAFAYPYSQPLWGSSFANDRWNYGELDATTGIDSDQIQLQGAAHQSATTWDNAIQALVTEYHAYGLPASAISVQLTVAQGDPNDISVSAAYADYQYAVQSGVGQVILWWDSGSVNAFLTLLTMIRG
jgi:hypothetical protein